jgi:hypothetical protein
MPLSDTEAQLLLVRKIGDVDPDTGDPVQPTSVGGTGIVLANITRLWSSHSSKANLSTTLRDLYVQRDGLDLVIGVLERLVDLVAINGAVNVRLSQRIQARQKQRDAVQSEIQRIEAALPSNSSAGRLSVGPIAAVTPISRPSWGDLPPNASPYGPDANDPRYGGSPYWPQRFYQGR